MSKTNTIIKNSIYGIIGQFIVYLLTFIVRKVFLIYLSLEYLGYQSLFNNIFSMLNFAELGIGTAICYQLYDALANNDITKVNLLMSIYKKIYSIVGIIILLIGSLLSPFLHFIIIDNTAPWWYLRIIYFLMLFNISVGYFLSYRKTFYTISQNDYKIVSIDIIIKIIFFVLEICTLIYFKNFIIYLFIEILNSITSNIIIYFKANCDYSFLNDNVKITFSDIKNNKIFTDTKNLIVNKFVNIAFICTDTILISKLFGINEVALYTNYTILYNTARSFTFSKITQAVNPTLANILYSENDLNNNKKLFYRIDMFNNLFSIYFSIAFFCFYQIVIKFWIGEKYLLDYKFIVVYCIFMYFQDSFEVLCSFRNAFGQFEFDRKYLILSAISNIVFSIPLSIIFGLPGIILGTFAGLSFIFIGRAKFVFNNFFKISCRKYFLKHFIYLIEYLIIIFVCYCFVINFSLNYYTIFFRLILFTVVPTFFIFIFFFNNNDTIELVNFLFYQLNSITNKLKYILKHG